MRVAAGAGAGGAAGSDAGRIVGKGGSGVVMLRYRLGPKAVWSATPPLFAMGTGSHTLTVGASAGTARISHVRFHEGGGTCFFHPKVRSDDVCEQCPSGTDTVSPHYGADSCRTCTAPGRVFDEDLEVCTCKAGESLDEVADMCRCSSGYAKF